MLAVSPAEGETQKTESVIYRDTTVTDKPVTSLYACVLQVLKSEPDRKMSPKEITTILHANPDAVRQALKRHSSPLKGSGLVIKVDYGLYQYSADKNGQLSTMISHSGRIGIENLTYVTSRGTVPRVTSRNTPELLQTDSNSDTLPTAKAGYPRHLQTGQEIRWEQWSNGSERVSFVSNGNPFSVDLILYLHEELAREGFKGDEWKRVSVEVNRDGRTLSLNPECMTLQETQGVLLKVYNHGQQARFEVADRTGVSMKDTLSLFLKYSDDGDGKTALRKFKELEERLTRAEKVGRLALDVGTREREKRIESKPGPKGKFSSVTSPFKTALKIKQERASAAGPAV